MVTGAKVMALVDFYLRIRCFDKVWWEKQTD
jgi:hypothetical protein